MYNSSEYGDLLFLKKGEIKTGLFSKRIAVEIRFFENYIISRPLGLNRLFNSADIVIKSSDILSIRDGERILGYNINVETKYNKFVFSFMGDKLKIIQLFNNYVN